MYMLYIIIVITYMLNILKQHSLADKVFGTKSYVKKKKKKGDVNVYFTRTQQSSSLFFNFY